MSMTANTLKRDLFVQAPLPPIPSDRWFSIPVCDLFLHAEKHPVTESDGTLHKVWCFYTIKDFEGLDHEYSLSAYVYRMTQDYSAEEVYQAMITLERAAENG